MSRVRDRALSAITAVAAFAVMLVFAVAVFVGIDRSQPPPSVHRTVSEWMQLCRPRPNYSPPPEDCAAVFIDEPIVPSRRPYDPTP